MKLKSFAFLFFLLFFSLPGFSKDLSGTDIPLQLPHGAELSHQVQKSLESSGFKTTKSNIVYSPGNDLPYNISLVIKGNSVSDTENLRNKLLFVISQDDFYLKADFYTNLLTKLSAETYDFDIHFLLAFNNKNDFPGFQTVSAENAFLSGIENKQNYSAILFSTENDDTKVISGSGGQISPTWLVKDIYNAINKNRLLSSFRSCYISFLYKQNLFAETELEAFLTAGIPSVCVKTSRNLSPESITSFFMDFCSAYDINKTVYSDTHSIMFTLFHKSIWISETHIIQSIIITIFFTAFLLILYGFLNKNLHFRAWKRIKKIWFYPVIVFILAEGVLFIYKNLLNSLSRISCEISLYTSICFILPLIFCNISLFFFTILKFTPNFKKRTIDFLTFITASINLFLFPLIDISLYPIFVAEFILAWIATVFPHNFIHFFILLAFEIPFLPFLSQFLNNTDAALISNLISKSTALSTALFLILIPQYLNCFRVFTGINFYWIRKRRKMKRKDLKNTIILTSFLVAFEILLVVFLPVSLGQQEKPLELIETEENIITIKNSERDIFEDKIRRVEIHSQKELLSCDIKVSGTNSNPVLFSDYENFSFDSTTTLFPLPYMPPKDVAFTYGTTRKETSKITITAVFLEDGKYYKTTVVSQE